MVPGAEFKPPEQQHRSARHRGEDLESEAFRAPIRSATLRRLMLAFNHPCRKFVDYVCDGLRDGFHLGVRENDEGFHLDNSKTARDWEDKVDEWLDAELAAHRLLGPFDPYDLPHPRAQVSPLGTAHKKCYEVGVIKRRVIYNLSSGPGRCHDDSVNGSTYAEPSVTYDTIDDAANVLRRFGPSAHLAKSDAEAAFRQLPVHPSAYHRLGVSWRGSTYFDTRVPFGLRMAPFIYASFSDAVRFVVQSRINKLIGEDNCVILSLLDDFLVIGRDKMACEAGFRILLSTFDEICLPFVQSKTESPTQHIEFLGILFSFDPAQGWCIGLPSDKHEDLRGKLLRMVNCKTTVRKHDLLSLAGSLGFAHPVVPLGRPRCSEMFRLAHRGGYSPKHFQHTTADLRDDCRAWLRSISLVSPRQPISVAVPAVAHLRVAGDAAGTEGFGAFCNFGSFWCPWHPSLVAKQPGVSSTLQELFCAVTAIELWKHLVPSGQVLEYWTDNDCMVHDLRKGRSSIKPINSLLILISEICVRDRITIRFCWASRTVPEQQCADCLSRNDQAGFLLKFGECRSGTVPPPLPIPTSEAAQVLTCLRW